ncbi:MAG: multicopper oxidase domain-containing protein [Thermomicrobiales bacterium]|nr:multicopper oxidase domain-containing protein [Thermomicrobiales bacterium]
MSSPVVGHGIEQFLAGMPGSRADRRTLLRRVAGAGLALPALGALGANVASAQEQSTAPVQPFALYDPVLPPVEPGVKDITVTAKDANLLVAKNVAMSSWTFDGTIPGKMLRVTEGDTVNFTFAVDPAASIGHSLDFHSAKTAPNINYRSINPGESFSWSFTAKYPGAFMYHCGTPPVLMHIGAGMYGAMIVDPKEGWSPAQEFAFVQSEIFLKDDGSGIMQPDYTKMLGNGMMDYCVFNGYANQYVENPIAVEVNAPVRVFVVNAGPDVWSSFHVVGTIFDAVYVNGNPANKLVGLQSISIGPGDGAVVEFTLDEPGEYPFVNHAFGHAAHGAVGIFQAS